MNDLIRVPSPLAYAAMMALLTSRNAVLGPSFIHFHGAARHIS